MLTKSRNRLKAENAEMILRVGLNLRFLMSRQLRMAGASEDKIKEKLQFGCDAGSDSGDVDSDEEADGFEGAAADD